MKSHWLAQTGAPDLILIFGGWALGAAPFAGLTGDQDLLFYEDYRDLDLPAPDRSTYETVSVLAYSFGVAAALHWLDQTGFAPDHLVAINGTPCPADPGKGIAPDRVRATAEGLSEASFARFCRRAGVDTPPPIDIPARREELITIADRGPAAPRRFDKIWISTNDRIIPPAAQRAAWADQVDRVTEIDAPHMPFAEGQTMGDWLT